RGVSFTNEAKTWGLETPAFSNGAAYGDLDGDGALDLVVNNVNDEAFVYRNNARSVVPDNTSLQIQLEGEGTNRFAIGARVTLWSGAERLAQELHPTRGFQSSVDYLLTFGAGTRSVMDSLTVEWPDGRRSVLAAVSTNQRLTVRQADARAVVLPTQKAPAPLFADITAKVALDFVHRENEFVDFDRERLIPRMVSSDGPTLAVADVNGDGLDDMFIGGAKEQPGALRLQRRDGSFARSSAHVFQQDSTSEDVGAVFFDANGDRTLDLYVVSGGNDFSDASPALQDRLYLNDGRGVFQKAAPGAIPTETIAGSRVVATDYDADGDVDLFVGGRVIPWHYGRTPHSMLLRNDGRGRFVDVATEAAPDLAQVGMVTDAAWQDVNGDGRVDLVVVGDWMPITIFHNEGAGRLTRATVRGLDKSSGWWNRIVSGDFTGDGRVDFVVGNLGLNSILRASGTEPATLYIKDFDGNGFEEQVLACYSEGRNYPFVMRDELVKAIPSLKARYFNYTDYAKSTVADIFPETTMAGAVVRTSHTFATSLVRNNGDGSFTVVPLPPEAQRAPVFGVLSGDFDRDGTTDLLLGGNFDGVQTQIGRLGASYGLLLRGERKGGFVAVSSSQSGFFVTGQVRDIQRLRTAGGEVIVVARNNDRVLIFGVSP
ncbi:MAG: FG-GAP-like repeat-containing protein, partial [Gemmatimonadaceae bacterium]